MIPEIWQYLSPVAGLAVNCFSQMVFVLSTRMSLLKSIVLSTITGEVGLVLISVPYLTWKWFVVSQVAYLAASFCYFAFVNLNATSLRIRILEELRVMGGRASLRSLMTVYGGEDVLQARIDRLIRSGMLLRRGDRLYVAKHYPLYVARFMDALRNLLLK
jgi:hypothetical protein